MNEETAQQILAELISIRKLLELDRKPKPSPTGTAARPGSDDIPQPSQLVRNPELVLVHFGKNKDVSLGELSMRSVEWYAQEPEQKLDRNGKPFPPREIDIKLRNAARQIVHRFRGTLAVENAAPIATEPNNLNDNEQVPF